MFCDRRAGKLPHAEHRRICESNVVASEGQAEAIVRPHFRLTATEIARNREVVGGPHDVAVSFLTHLVIGDADVDDVVVRESLMRAADGPRKGVCRKPRRTFLHYRAVASS